MARETISKIYLGETFTFETEVNSENQSLWDARVDSEFKTWLADLFLTKKDLFEYTISLPSSTVAILNQIKLMFQFNSLEELLPKLVLIYINNVDGKIQPYKRPQDQSTQSLTLTFKPQDITSVISIATLVEMTPKAVVEHSLIQISELANTGNKEHALFWGKTILPKILRDLSI